MDTLDVRILRRVFQGQVYSPLGSASRESLGSVAKRLGVDEDTVRRRLKRLQDSGFIPAWRLYLNPHLWGGGQVSVWLDLNSAASKREIVARLGEVRGVLAVHVAYDGLIVFHEHDDEWSLPRVVESIRVAAGAADAFVARIAFPEGPFAVADRDWDLIRVFRGNPWKPYAEVAAESGLSGRTTRARLSHLFDQGIAFAWPSLDFAALEGGVLAELIAWCPSDRRSEVDGAIAGLVEPYLWHTMDLRPYRRGDPAPCAYNLLASNVPETQEVLARVKELPGVERARIYLNESVHTFFDAYDERLVRRLGRRGSGPPVSGRGGVGRTTPPGRRR